MTGRDDFHEDEPHRDEHREGEDAQEQPAEPAGPESLPESERVDEESWQGFVDSIRMTTASVPDVSPEEIQDVLDDEDWEPPEPEPVGWRTASPGLVLGLAGALGGLLALMLGVLFFRPLPGWVLLVLLTVTLASGAVLFSRLPGTRDPGAGGGEV